MKTEQIKQKRQNFHKLLIALGEVRYKEVIVSARFNVDSTTELTEKQLDELINDASHRLAQREKPRAATGTDDKTVRLWRNRCLQVLNQRGITATPSDWTAINAELEKKQYQWIVPLVQLAKGHVNHKGLYAFNSVADLKKLFNQLSAIRDNEQAHAKRIRELAAKN